jgi:hypothetical protein
MNRFLPRTKQVSAAFVLAAFALVASAQQGGGIGASVIVVATPNVFYPSAAPVSVAVDATHVVRTVDDRMFGVNTAVWDSAFNNTETLPLLEAVDMRTLRFPGGSTSDEYSWSMNKSYDRSTGVLNPWSWSITFDHFAATATGLGAQAFITTNYGSGTAQEAADWVAYSKSKGYGFKYWEIGNECYGNWEYDKHPIKNDPFTYGTEAANYITKMKAADPSIKVGIVLIDGEDAYSDNARTAVTNARTGVSHKGWSPLVLARLKALGVMPDFAIFHRYPYGPFGESDAALLGGRTQSGTTWAQDAAGLRAQLNDYLGAVEGPKVELVVTENNSVYSDTGKQTTSLVNALFYADSVGAVLQTEFNSLVWWALRNGPQDKTHNNTASLYGWRNYGDYGIIAPGNATETAVSAPYPVYYMMKLVSHFARGGDQVVQASTSSTDLTAYAAKRADGSLTLLVVNKSRTDSIPADFTVSGFTPAAHAALRSYGIPQDEAVRLGVGSPEPELSTLNVGTTFSGSFAPYSASVITLYPNTVGTSRIINLSVRATAAAGSQTLIVGFVIGGSGTSGQLPVLVTALGPKLASLGVAGALPDPQLALHTEVNHIDTIATANDNWGDTDATLGATFARLGASGLTAGSLDAALYANLDAKPYAAHVNTPAGGGVALSEVYDGSVGATASTPRLVNISGRAQVGLADNVLIAGFVVNGSGPKTVLIRGLGPRLAAFGVSGSLSTPKLELHTRVNGQDTILASNTAWGGAASLTALFTQLGAVGLPDSSSKDAVIAATLDPGVYSAVVSGAGSATGVALVEIYEVP